MPVVMPRPWKRATRSNPVPVRGVAVRRGLRTAATTGAMTWLPRASRKVVTGLMLRTES